MNNMVNKLLDVDKEARQMLDEAQQYYEQTLFDIQEEKKRLQDEYSKKAQRHIQDLQSEESAAVDDAVTVIRRETAALLKSMETHYEQNHKQWELEIAQKCIGR